MTDFERIKKSAKPECENTTLRIPLTWTMGSSYTEIKSQSIESTLKGCAKKHGVDYKNFAIILSDKAVRRIFEPVTKPVVKHIGDLIATNKLQPLSYMFMVGGFSECAFLHQAVRARFNKRVLVLVPTEAQMSVIKGAVMFGHSPDSITIRIARRTYGYSTTRFFEQHIHDETKKVLLDGIAHCRDIFSTFVTKGDEIELGSQIVKHFRATCSQQISGGLNFYCIDDVPRDPQYITDADVESLGLNVTVGMPNTERGRMRTIELTVEFGGTELDISAKDVATGTTVKASIGF